MKNFFRQNSFRPAGWFLILSLLLILSQPARAATIVVYQAQLAGAGKNRDIIVNTRTGNPLGSGTNIFSGPQTYHSTNGTTSFVIRPAGTYKLQIDGVTATYYFPVPDSTNSYNILDLINAGMSLDAQVPAFAAGTNCLITTNMVGGQPVYTFSFAGTNSGSSITTSNLNLLGGTTNNDGGFVGNGGGLLGVLASSVISPLATDNPGQKLVTYGGSGTTGLTTLSTVDSATLNLGNAILIAGIFTGSLVGNSSTATLAANTTLWGGFAATPAGLASLIGGNFWTNSVRGSTYFTVSTNSSGVVAFGANLTSIVESNPAAYTTPAQVSAGLANVVTNGQASLVTLPNVNVQVGLKTTNQVFYDVGTNAARFMFTNRSIFTAISPNDTNGFAAVMAVNPSSHSVSIIGFVNEATGDYMTMGYFPFHTGSEPEGLIDSSGSFAAGWNERTVLGSFLYPYRSFQIGIHDTQYGRLNNIINHGTWSSFNNPNMGYSQPFVHESGYGNSTKSGTTQFQLMTQWAHAVDTNGTSAFTLYDNWATVGLASPDNIAHDFQDSRAIIENFSHTNNGQVANILYGNTAIKNLMAGPTMFNGDVTLPTSYTNTPQVLTTWTNGAAGATSLTIPNVQGNGNYIKLTVVQEDDNGPTGNGSANYGNTAMQFIGRTNTVISGSAHSIMEIFALSNCTGTASIVWTNGYAAAPYGTYCVALVVKNVKTNGAVVFNKSPNSTTPPGITNTVTTTLGSLVLDILGCNHQNSFFQHNKQREFYGYSPAQPYFAINVWSGVGTGVSETHPAFYAGGGDYLCMASVELLGSEITPTISGNSSGVTNLNAMAANLIPLGKNFSYSLTNCVSATNGGGASNKGITIYVTNGIVVNFTSP